MNSDTTLVANQAQFLCEVEGAPSMQVVAFTGTEAISFPFRFVVDVATLDDWVEPEQVLGAPTLLTFESSTGPRYVSGMLDSVLYLGRNDPFALYRIEVAPLLWFLSYSRRSRIFQDMTTPEILAHVLEGGGVPSDRFRFAFTRDYTPRNYCVQYRETDLEFLHRLMEDEGMFYFFEHTADGHTLVVADDSVVHVDLPDTPELPFRPRSGMVPGSQSISTFAYRLSIRPDKVMLRDYSYKRPGLDVQGLVQGDRFASLEEYDYPGAFVTPELGETFAEVRWGAHRVRRRFARGSGDCRGMTPGYLFSLTQHPDDVYNGCYLVTRVHHRGRQPQALEELAASAGPAGYGNEFEVIPADVTFRPQRRARRPIIPGVQTATVVGPEGEEVYTDQDGRIKVMFHWDRAEDVSPEARSCWIRVAQPWAGNQFGVVFVPRIGQEVVVQFLEGDPNRPLVTGVVYNGQNPPPYGTPDANTISGIRTSTTPGGGGYNELRFEDAQGSEEVFLHAQRDLNEVVEQDHNSKVGGDRYQQVDGDVQVFIGGQREETVKEDVILTVENGDRVTVLGEGDDRLVVQQGDRQVHVEEGDLEEHVAGDRATRVDGDDTLDVGGDRKVKVVGGDFDVRVKQGSMTLNAQGSTEAESQEFLIQSHTSIVLRATTKITLQVGLSTLTLSPKGVEINGPTITSEAKGVHQIKGMPVTMN